LVELRICLEIDDKLLEEIDAYAILGATTREDMIRSLIELGLIEVRKHSKLYVEVVEEYLKLVSEGVRSDKAIKIAKMRVIKRHLPKQFQA